MGDVMAIIGFIGLVLVVLAILTWIGLLHLAVAAVPLAVVGALMLVAYWYFGYERGPRRRL